MHSTETAFLKVENDLLRNLDDGKITVLVLLDLSAAFDTMDHSGVISLLENWYSISGNALRWFASYLMDQQQMVKVKKCVDEPFQTKYGVPHGSVLEPFLFTLYTTPSKIFSRHNVCHHLYADDARIYITLSKSEPEMSLALLQHCLFDVGHWMRSSKLKLNPDKTELLLFGTKLHRKKIMKHFPAKLLDQEIRPTDSARNIGVVFDGGLNFRKHITLACRSCYYHIRDSRRLRRCLTSVSKTIATALVSSKLDYCNGLLYNVTNRELNRLQRVQNCLTPVVTRSPRVSRTTPLLKSLHWLPVCFRIKLKICLVTYEALCSNHPIYLKEMLTPPKRIRSSDQNVLFFPRIKTKKGDNEDICVTISKCRF